MIQLAIDPACKCLGWSVMDSELPVGKDILKYGSIVLGKDIKLQAKIGLVHEVVSGLMKQYKPNVLVLEDQHMAMARPHMMTVFRMVGGIIHASFERNVDTVLYTPTAIKKAITGKGNATKIAVATAVSEIYSKDAYVSLLTFSGKQTKSVDKTDDIYDSIAINYTHRTLLSGEVI